jgi:glycosyltransferase involved in cell wall biosynthesis
MTSGVRIIVIIPAHNEEASISLVISDIRQHLPMADILVVDDGSTDDCASQAVSAGAIVLRLPFNLGIGGAVQLGYRFASEMNYDLVARLDADGQHEAIYLPQLIESVISDQVDVVIGSRYMTGDGYHASRLRGIGTKLFARVVSLITGQHFSDTTSGFQATNRKAVAFLAAHLPSDYPEIEGLVLLCRAGFRVSEMPVTMRPRHFGQSSITPFRSVYYVFKVVLALFIELLRKPIPGRLAK